jgi:hypothetical protein
MADGLKKLRKKQAAKPTYKCENCGCMRYTRCTCMKSGDVPNDKTTKKN